MKPTPDDLISGKQKRNAKITPISKSTLTNCDFQVNPFAIIALFISYIIRIYVSSFFPPNKQKAAGRQTPLYQAIIIYNGE